MIDTLMKAGLFLWRNQTMIHVLSATKQALLMLGQTVQPFTGRTEFKMRYPCFDGDPPQHVNSYSSHACGWVDAERVMEVLTR